MKKAILKLLGITFLILSVSCSSDSANPTPNTLNLNQTIVYTPDSSNYVKKVVTNYQNNKKINEIEYNGSNVLMEKDEYTYDPGKTTVIMYDPQGAYLRKEIYYYDASNRISKVEFYNNGQTELSNTRQYEYEGNNINVYNIGNGTSTFIYNYKTNSDNLLYYEKDIIANIEQTLSYTDKKPTHLNYAGVESTFEYYTIVKPAQSNTTDINNYALEDLALQHTNLSCNYYLKKAIYPSSNVFIDYSKTFNSDLYPTHMQAKSVYFDGVSPDEPFYEIFYFYE